MDKSTSSWLVKTVEKLHSDKKFNKKAEEVAANYERNLLTNQKKKSKKKQARKIAAAQSEISKNTAVSMITNWSDW